MKFYSIFLGAIICTAFCIPQVSRAETISSLTLQLATLKAQILALQTTPSSDETTGGSCSIKSSKSSVKPGQKFTLSWKTKNISMPTMNQQVKAGGIVPVKKKGTLKWTAEPNKSWVVENDIFEIGFGGMGVSTSFTPLCSVKVDIKPSKKVNERNDNTKKALEVYEGIKKGSSCGNGNDYYDGGDDVDTLSYSGKRSEFEIMKLNGGGFLIADTVPCRADTDVAVNIELFKFADKTLKADEL